MMQSGNGYVCGGNNPGRYQDLSGMMFEPISTTIIGDLTVVFLGCTLIGLTLYLSYQIVFTDSYGKSIIVDSFALPADQVAQAGRDIGLDIGIDIGLVIGPIIFDAYYGNLSEQELNSISNGYPVANPSNAMRSEAKEESDTKDDANQQTERKYKKPKQGSGKDFVKRLCDTYFGKGNYNKKGQSDYSKIRKWGDRGFE